MKLLSFVAIASMFATVSPAIAAKQDFQACDGMKSPSKDEDGLANQPNDDTYGYRFSGYMGRLAAQKVKNCTAALEDERLLSQQNLRRANLLLHRAMAYVDLNNPDQALIDIEAAETATQSLASDPLFKRTMAVSLMLAKASAFAAKGNYAEARIIARNAVGGRPYSTKVHAAASYIIMQSDSALDEYSDPMRSLSRLSPDVFEIRFSSAITAGRFSEALILYRRIKPQNTALNSSTAIFAQSPVVKDFLDEADRAVNASYALAATGKPTEARALFSEISQRVQAALGPDKRQNGPVTDFALIKAVFEWLSTSKKLVEARALVADGKSADGLKLLVGTSIPNTALGLDLVQSMHASLPADKQSLAPESASIAIAMAEKRKEAKFNATQLLTFLPAPERTEKIATYKKANKSILDGLTAGYAQDGFRSKTNPASGITTVEFLGKTASAITVEELTLLHAADLARRQGKKGLLIVARRDFRRTLQRTYNGIPQSSSSAGFKSELDVRFVDLTNIPPEVANDADRLLDVDAIYNNLAPIYVVR
jgi:tetratricopeptide (TPR) repeat protein